MATAGLVEQSADLNDLVDENDVKEEGDEDEEVCIFKSSPFQKGFSCKMFWDSNPKHFCMIFWRILRD